MSIYQKGVTLVRKSSDLNEMFLGVSSSTPKKSSKSKISGKSTDMVESMLGVSNKSIDDTQSKKKRKRKLSAFQVLKIKCHFRYCEIPGCSGSHDELHHINGDRTDDSYKNLIVLCRDHHGQAGGHNLEGVVIFADELREIVKNRDPRDAKAVKFFLKSNKKASQRKTEKSPKKDFLTDFLG